jgi:hypothetical protein
MIGRKLLMLQSGKIEMVNQGEEVFGTPYFLEEWKHSTIKNTKRYGYIALVETIRFYFRLNNFLKSKYQEIKAKAKGLYEKRQSIEDIEKREVSKFLKMVSEYKSKIRKIKDRVKEEEEENL